MQHWYAEKRGCELRKVDVGAVSLEVATAGMTPANDKPLVVCLHGFPSVPLMLYKHQIPFLVEKGYAVAAPCLRGFGHSSAPEDVSSYGAVTVVEDIAGLVTALGYDRCILLAHDWVRCK